MSMMQQPDLFNLNPPADGAFFIFTAMTDASTTLLQLRLKDKVLIAILGNLQSIDREVIVSLLNKTLQ